MTAGEIVDYTQNILNDPQGVFFTDAMTLAAVNRANREISRLTRYLGVITADITTDGTTYTFPLPTLTGVGTLFDLTEDPVYDGTSCIARTTQEALAAMDPLWRTKTTADSPTHCVMAAPAKPPARDVQGYVTFYPGPTTAAKTIRCAGHAVAAGLGTDDTPLLPIEVQPVLIYASALDLIAMIGESASAMDKRAVLLPKYRDYMKMILAETGTQEVPRWIRGGLSGTIRPTISLGTVT